MGPSKVKRTAYAPIRSMRFTNKERFCTPITDSITSYSINPGLIFPWLKVQAQCWEKYKFHKLEFRYVPGVPTTQAGTVALTFDFDAEDSIPGVLDELCVGNYVTTPVWKPTTLHVDLKLGDRLPQKNVRGELSNFDAKDEYDVGMMIVGVTGYGSVVSVGTIEVIYDVEFFMPQVETSTLEGFAAARTSATVDSTTPLYAAGITEVGGIKLGTSVLRTLTLPAGHGVKLSSIVETASEETDSRYASIKIRELGQEDWLSTAQAATAGVVEEKSFVQVANDPANPSLTKLDTILNLLKPIEVYFNTSSVGGSESTTTSSTWMRAIDVGFKLYKTFID